MKGYEIMKYILNSKKVLFAVLAAVLFSACFMSIPTKAEAIIINTVTYLPNGGNGCIEVDSYLLGCTYKIRENMFTRPGYVFDGWKCALGCKYAPGYKMCIGSLILCAQWKKAPTVTATYYANGGSGTTIIDSVNPGSIYTIRENSFTRSGYNFNGWNTKANGSGTNYSPKQVIQLTSSIALYAQWTKCPTQYKITYYPNGGTPNSNIIDSVNSGASHTIRAANTFTRTGYTFTGWNTKENGSGTNYAAGQVITVYGNISLYAQWKKDASTQTWTITYKPNGGTPNSDVVVTVPQGSQHTILPGTTFTRAGRDFMYWSTSTNNGTKYYPGNIITVNSNMTLFAIWSPGM